jgi:hypothetical protein
MAEENSTFTLDKPLVGGARSASTRPTSTPRAARQFTMLLLGSDVSKEIRAGQRVKASGQRRHLTARMAKSTPRGQRQT